MPGNKNSVTYTYNVDYEDNLQTPGYEFHELANAKIIAPYCVGQPHTTRIHDPILAYASYIRELEKQQAIVYILPVDYLQRHTKKIEAIQKFQLSNNNKIPDKIWVENLEQQIEIEISRERKEFDKAMDIPLGPDFLKNHANLILSWEDFLKKPEYVTATEHIKFLIKNDKKCAEAITAARKSYLKGKFNKDWEQIPEIYKEYTDEYLIEETSVQWLLMNGQAADDKMFGFKFTASIEKFNPLLKYIVEYFNNAKEEKHRHVRFKVTELKIQENSKRIFEPKTSNSQMAASFPPEHKKAYTLPGITSGNIPSGFFFNHIMKPTLEAKEEKEEADIHVIHETIFAQKLRYTFLMEQASKLIQEAEQCKKQLEQLDRQIAFLQSSSSKNEVENLSKLISNSEYIDMSLINTTIATTSSKASTVKLKVSNS